MQTCKFTLFFFFFVADVQPEEEWLDISYNWMVVFCVCGLRHVIYFWATLVVLRLSQLSLLLKEMLPALLWLKFLGYMASACALLMGQRWISFTLTNRKLALKYFRISSFIWMPRYRCSGINGPTIDLEAECSVKWAEFHFRLKVNKMIDCLKIAGEGKTTLEKIFVTFVEGWCVCDNLVKMILIWGSSIFLLYSYSMQHYVN